MLLYDFIFSKSWSYQLVSHLVFCPHFLFNFCYTNFPSATPENLLKGPFLAPGIRIQHKNIE